MRRCIVDKCTNTDNIVPCHRFPKNRILASKWQISLNLTGCPLDTLISKYCVCCQHFDSTDYRNSVTNSLNTTAVPKLQGINPRPYAALRTKNAPLQLAQSIPTTNHADQPSVSPVNSSDSIELLHKDDNVTEFEESVASNNDEMYILEEEDLNTTDDLIQSIDGADFTMLDAASCAVYAEEAKKVETTEESPFVVESIGDMSNHSHEFRSSSTDSDVEVLVSEAVFESEWSHTELSTDRSAVILNTSQTNTCESAASACISYQSDLPTKANDVGVTFLDSEFGHLDRTQLLDVIKSQSMKIEQLENQLSTYKLAHEQLFGYFDAFRNTVCDVHL